MTDEISLGKARIVLLPVILGLVMIFFLKLFSIKISFLIWVILLVVIFLISLLLTMKSKVSLTSKLSTTSIKTIFWFLFAIVVIVTITFAIISLWPDSRQEVCLNHGYLVKDEYDNKWICGNVEFKKVGITTKSPDYRFSILGLGEREAKVTVTFEEGGLQRREFSFTAGNSEEIQFGAGASGIVYAFVNGIDLQEAGEVPKMNFYTDGQKYNVTVRIETGKSCEAWKCSRFYKRNSEVVDRNDLLGLNMVGLIKFDF